MLENLNNELEELNSFYLFVCGKLLSKRYRRYGKRQFMEFESLTSLLGNQEGRNKLTQILKVLN